MCSICVKVSATLLQSCLQVKPQKKISDRRGRKKYFSTVQFHLKRHKTGIYNTTFPSAGSGAQSLKLCCLAPVVRAAREPSGYSLQLRCHTSPPHCSQGFLSSCSPPRLLSPAGMRTALTGAHLLVSSVRSRLTSS